MNISGTNSGVISTAVGKYGSLPIMEMMSERKQGLYFLPSNLVQVHALKIMFT